MNPDSRSPIVLYDGVCALCNFWVNFVIARDPVGAFRFAPLQSSTGQEIAGRFGEDPSRLSSLLLIHQDIMYSHSDAALRILGLLGGSWGVVSRAGLLVPKVIRDVMYRAVAATRYKIFGRLDTCPIPSPEVRSRFLDLS